MWIIQGVYKCLLDTCPHKIIPNNLKIDEELKLNRWASTGAYCEICGKDFGWWCPKSPSHVCSYFKSEDDCDFCHMPKERKR